MMLMFFVCEIRTSIARHIRHESCLSFAKSQMQAASHCIATNQVPTQGNIKLSKEREASKGKRSLLCI